ncbi:MAG TPA: class II glutamine amidotransferase [Streptosporangiaceae bacterium]
MCRLLGLHAGTRDVAARFWLIDAPDSLDAQSHRNPDGAGVGTFGRTGEPAVSKQPIAAWEDAHFAAAARDLRGTTFVAHVRYASTGAHTMANTHPFVQDDRLFAHNGVVQGLGELDRRLAELGAAGLVGGETDSERIFALITAETRRHGGDVTAGLTEAIGWISARLPVYALNLVLITATDLWALRYPATHELYVLDRPAGGPTAGGHTAGGPAAGGQPANGRAADLGTSTGQPLDAASHRIHALSPDLARQASVVIASERMDDDPGWRLLAPGELLHVSSALQIDSTAPFPAEPAHRLQVSDLDPAAASSQHPQAAPS